jgi:hypothetical protein
MLSRECQRAAVWKFCAQKSFLWGVLVIRKTGTFLPATEDDQTCPERLIDAC